MSEGEQNCFCRFPPRNPALGSQKRKPVDMIIGWSPQNGRISVPF